MQKLKRSFMHRYSVAVLTVGVAVLFTHLLWWLFKPTLYPLFLAAVMVSSWYGGIEPGLLTTALAALTCAYFFIPPLYSLAVVPTHITGLLQFVVVALLIATLNSVLRSTQRRAEMHAIAAERNYERLQQTQENLRQTEERYRLLVEGATDYAIFMLNPQGNIVSWNVGAERILGYQEAEIVGQPFSSIFTPEAIEQGQPEQVLHQAIAQGFSRENRWHVRKDGNYFWAHCFITPLGDESLRGFAKIMQDITGRKQAEEEREELLKREQAARAEAEKANRLKDDFLAVLSHELRTPMTAILGWARMFRAGKLDQARAAIALETIERNANLQMQLIEDLLDVSRIIKGELALNYRSVELVDVIRAAVEVVQSMADAKAIQLTSRLNSAAITIWGDAERLQQVMWNLLSNAIKFTPEGGRVEVQLSVVKGNRHKQSSVSNYAQIQVIDTGIGISQDFLPYIFDRFRQADSSSTRLHKGLGLGLAIARHLVELHGGTITAQSPGKEQGATFTIKLPLIKRVQQLETKVHGEGSSAGSISLSGLQILVVDDEADTLKLISTILEDRQAKVVAVSSVDEALAAISQLQPDVLVSDIGMPGKDGYALMDEVRQLQTETGKKIPAIALTAYANAEDIRKAVLAGFQVHLAKPVNANDLIAAVAKLANLEF